MHGMAYLGQFRLRARFDTSDGQPQEVHCFESAQYPDFYLCWDEHDKRVYLKVAI